MKSMLDFLSENHHTAPPAIGTAYVNAPDKMEEGESIGGQVFGDLEYLHRIQAQETEIHCLKEALVLHGVDGYEGEIE